ncbi:nucleotide sugar dehydrogenase [Priestia megaterium]|uniref:nucleotide sugar dehydrogenase n=1 Tax=Priestia megaterium TaxID=1404 RepID=UPI003000E4A2
MKVCILGLGYIGLPTALMFANHETEVHGVDVNPTIIKKLNQKELHIYEPGLIELLNQAIETKLITFSTTPVHSDAFIISVPTPVTENKCADLKFVVKAIEMILPFLKKGNLIVLESTVPPKTVVQTILPLLERTNLEVGKDLFVSYSPERVLPGNLINEIINNDRIIGGINSESTQLAVNLYKRFVKGTIHETDSTTAEMVKLIENTYRDINIAFANELAQIGDTFNINIWHAIELANNHPRVNIHTPGPGVGGHCIAVDPWFIANEFPDHSDLIKLSRIKNESMPLYVVKTIKNLLETIQNPVITILGLSYKGNIDDTRESPSLEVLSQLKKENYKVKAYDPYVNLDLPEVCKELEDAVKDTDCILVLTNHDNFSQLDFEKISKIVRRKVIFDTRNVINSTNAEKFGFSYNLLGNAIQKN